MTDPQEVAETLSIGETWRGKCPECGRKDFTVTRESQNVAVYNCFRATCSLLPGTVRLDGTKPVARIEKPDPSYRKAIRPMRPNEAALLMRKFDLTVSTLERAAIQYAPQDERYALPIRGPSGEKRGWWLRTYDLTVKPKVRVYKDRDNELMQHWVMSDARAFRPFVLVEDPISAIKLHQVCPHLGAVALLGTTLNLIKVQEIIDIYPKSVVVALDEDATDKAYEMAWDWRSVLSMSVQPLKRDIKNMSVAEIRELFS